MLSKLKYSMLFCVFALPTNIWQKTYIGLHYSGLKLIKTNAHFSDNKTYLLSISFEHKVNTKWQTSIVLFGFWCTHRITALIMDTGHLCLYSYLRHHAPSPSHNLAHFLRRTGLTEGIALSLTWITYFKNSTHI